MDAVTYKSQKDERALMEVGEHCIKIIQTNSPNERILAVYRRVDGQLLSLHKSEQDFFCQNPSLLPDSKLAEFCELFTFWRWGWGFAYIKNIPLFKKIYDRLPNKEPEYDILGMAAPQYDRTNDIVTYFVCQGIDRPFKVTVKHPLSQDRQVTVSELPFLLKKAVIPPNAFA